MSHVVSRKKMKPGVLAWFDTLYRASEGGAFDGLFFDAVLERALEMFPAPLGYTLRVTQSFALSPASHWKFIVRRKSRAKKVLDVRTLARHNETTRFALEKNGDRK